MAIIIGRVRIIGLTLATPRGICAMARFHHFLLFVRAVVVVFITTLTRGGGASEKRAENHVKHT